MKILLTNTPPVWLRACDQCGKLVITDPPPKEGYPDKAYVRWSDQPCSNCRSEALDYGHSISRFEAKQLIDAQLERAKANKAKRLKLTTS